MAKSILIVEDNELNMKLFCEVLESLGHNSVPARDGTTALALAREHHPDLILMDMQLPDISGLEVTQRIKNDISLQHIPIIAVTAFAMKGDEERILAGGCDAYIPKPIQMKEFLGVIQKMLGEN